MRNLILTRPQADSSALANTLQTHGIPTIISPCLNIELYSIAVDAADIDGVILTSRHALHAATGISAPCYVVGEHTATLAVKNGLNVTHVAATAEALAAALPHSGQLLYLSGEHVSTDFTEATQADIKRVVTYTAHAAETLEASAIDALHKSAVDGVVFYSARSAEVFGVLLESAALSHAAENLTAYCISLNTAASCAALPWGDVRIADAQDGQAMMELLLA